jgi:hypothetical protein
VLTRLLLVSSFVLAACGPSTPDGDGSGDDDGGDASLPDDDADVCRAPDVLIVLDRTGTMHRDLAGNTPPDTPDGHASAKLTMAIHAIEGLVGVPGIDATVRFGLSLFPRDPGSCITLTQRLQGVAFTNPACEPGEIVISPNLGTGAAIANVLDPETTTLCNTTPIGAALLTARAELDQIKKPDVEQFLLLVTDGADFEQSCPDPDPLEVLRDIEGDGIKTFVVGFGAQDTTAQGVNPPVLNQMACAGGTAKDFTTACTASPSGGYDAVDPDGAHVYFDAANADELTTALGDITGQICCGCVL